VIPLSYEERTPGVSWTPPVDPTSLNLFLTDAIFCAFGYLMSFHFQQLKFYGRKTTADRNINTK